LASTRSSKPRAALYREREGQDRQVQEVASQERPIQGTIGQATVCSEPEIIEPYAVLMGCIEQRVYTLSRVL
jgi:hypothetical protein